MANALLSLFTILAFISPAQAVSKTSCLSFYKPEFTGHSLSLLGRSSQELGLRLSEYGSTRDKTDLERGLTTNYSRISLKKALATTEGAKALLKHLLRLKVVTNTAADPIYAKFLLLAENKDIYLNNDRLHNDPEVVKYLENMKYKKLATQMKARPVLTALNEAERAQNLYFLFLSVFQSIKDHDVESRDAINAGITEIGRARERGHTLIEAIDTGMSSLKAYGTYIPRRIEIPEFIDTAAEFVPLNIGKILLTGVRHALHLYAGGSSREQKQQIFELGTEPALKSLVKGSEFFVFQKSDPRELKTKVDSFLKKFSNTTHLNTPEFAKAAIAAYPEIALVARAQKKLGRGASSKMITDGVYGTYPYDTYVRLSRMAMVLKIIQGQEQSLAALPHLRLADAKKLRQELVNDLSLKTGDRINLSALDRFFVFLNLDSIADSADSFIKQFDLEHSLSQRFGNLDKEKRISEILRRYKLASYSFARLSKNDQDLLFDALELSRQYNVIQVNRGELGAESLTHLSTHSNAETWQTLSLTYFSSMLTFAAEGPANHLAAGRLVTLNHEAFEQWDRAAELLYRSTADRTHSSKLSSPTDKSDERLRDEQHSIIQRKGLRLPESTPQEMVRLALLFDVKFNSELKALMDSFAALSEQNKVTIASMLGDHNIRWFHLSKTLVAIYKQTLNQASERFGIDTPISQKLKVSFDTALQQLVKFSALVDDNVAVNNLIVNQGKNTANVSLAPYYKLLETRGLQSIIQSHPVLNEAEGNGGLIITVP